MFGERFPVDFFIQQCRDIFGPKYDSAFLDAAVDRTNTFYGALNVEVTNVVFVHGSIDPWHSLGITKTLNQGAPAIFINGKRYITIFIVQCIVKCGKYNSYIFLLI